MVYTIPVLILLTFVLALIKKVSVFDSFTEGIKEALQLIFNLVPYLAAMFMATELMRASGLSVHISSFLEKPLSLLGIPKGLAEMIILRPMSGSGSLVLLENIITTFGVDSFEARLASVMMGSTDTALYVAAVYFSRSKDKKQGLSIPIALGASFLGIIISSQLLRFM